MNTPGDYTGKGVGFLGKLPMRIWEGRELQSKKMQYYSIFYLSNTPSVFSPFNFTFAPSNLENVLLLKWIHHFDGKEHVFFPTYGHQEQNWKNGRNFSDEHDKQKFLYHCTNFHIKPQSIGEKWRGNCLGGRQSIHLSTRSNNRRRYWSAREDLKWICGGSVRGFKQ